MKHRILLLACLLSLLGPTGITAQTPQRIEPLNGGELHMEQTSCLSEAQRTAIWQEIKTNLAALKQAGRLPEPQSRATVLFGWPLRLKTGLNDPSYWTISNHVDHEPNPNLKDYNCGIRTYNGHMGTDIALWPFGWTKMTNNEVEVVAAAAGTIIVKHDGNCDQQCKWNENNHWNAVYIQHVDGSVAWYGHLKKGLLTTKNVGATVAAGEYLGVVGSSGFSTGPHLHFEIYDSDDNLIDPFAGQCNNLNGNSWWSSQLPYSNPAINKIMTHSAVPTFGQCLQDEKVNASNQFQPGQTAYFAAYYRDQPAGVASTYTIRRPDNSMFDTWTHSNGVNYNASYAYWPKTFPADAPTGTWTFTVQFNGQTVNHNFTVGNVPAGGAVSWTKFHPNTLLDYGSNGGLKASTPNPNGWNNGAYGGTINAGANFVLTYKIRAGAASGYNQIMAGYSKYTPVSMGNYPNQMVNYQPDNPVGCFYMDGMLYYGKWPPYSGAVGFSAGTLFTLVYSRSNGVITASIDGNTIASENYNGLLAPHVIIWSDGSLVTLESAIVSSGSSSCSPNFGVNFTTTKPVCPCGSNGKLKANPTGATGPFTYQWSNGATTQEITNIPAGNYFVTVTANTTGCKTVGETKLGQPPLWNVEMTVKNNTCFGQSIGSVKASATGGTGTKTYLWSTNATTQTISNLAGGLYTVTVTDSKACATSAKAEVLTPTEVILSHSVQLLANGKYKITLSATGGTPYTSGLSHRYCRVSSAGSCSFNSTTTYSNLLPGTTYTFRARDSKNCQDVITVTLPSPKPGEGSIAQEIIQERISRRANEALRVAIVPNPTPGPISLQTEADIRRIALRDPLGRLVREANGSMLNGMDLTGLPAGLYLLEVSVEGEAAARVLKVVKE